VEQKLRKLAQATVFFVCLGSVAVQAATVNFKTFEAWHSPRFYFFFKISENLSSMTSLGNSKSTTVEIPFRKISAACPLSLNPQNLRVTTSSLQEVLLSSDRRWLALRVKDDSSDLPSLLDKLVLELSVPGNPEPCALKLDTISLREDSRQSLMPSIVFSGIEHRFSDQEFRISEDFLVAAIRYRVEASTGLRRVSAENVAVSAAMLGARASFWSNRLGFLGADLQVLQSIKTFPRDLSNAEWAFALSSRIHWARRGLSVSLKPFLGMRQLLLLSEVDVPLPQGSRSVSLLQAGASFDVEFAERWLLRGRGEYGFKEFDRLDTATVDWKSQSFEAALGYRLKAELRLLLEAGVHDISRAAEAIRKLDLVRLGVEMDF
jgi:hypothetical protein